MKYSLSEKHVAIIVVVALGFMILFFHAGFCLIIKDIQLQLGLPENCQPDPLLSTMISIAVAVYITLIVFMYSVKEKRLRNQRLTEQIRRYITLLLQGYNIDFAQPANQIDESFISQKNAISLHIHDMVHEISNKGINENLRRLISDTAIFALGLPQIIVPANVPNQRTKDYRQFQVLTASINPILDFLRKNRTDYEAIPQIIEDIRGLQTQLQNQQNNNP